jgi:tetratricopeptide (TPR) repeat protein
LDLLQRALNAKEYPAAYFRRAWVYADMGRNDLALADFKRFAKLEKDSDRYWPDERSTIQRLKALTVR